MARTLATSATSLVSEIADVSQLWAEFRRMPFPDDALERKIGGVCLATTDSFMAGCIESVLIERRALGDQQRALLDSCMKDLDRVLPSLQGNALDYFGLLHRPWRSGSTR